MSETVVNFDGLVLGLDRFLRQPDAVPHHALFQYACHRLALEMAKARYPRTLHGLLALFEQPVDTWCPLTVPQTFDGRCSLMYDGELSEEANLE